MNLAVISVCALALAVIVSCVSRLNVGVLAVALAWIVGVYIGGMPVEHRHGRVSQSALPDADRRHAALRAGAVERHARAAHASRRAHLPRQPRDDSGHVLRARRGARRRWGPATSPRRRSSRRWRWRPRSRAGIPLFLMAIMVGNGANAGALSPFAPTGIIVNGLMAQERPAGPRAADLSLQPAARTRSSRSRGYALFGGLKLFRRPAARSSATASRRRSRADDRVRAPSLDHAWRHRARSSSASSFAKVNVGMAAFAGAVVLVLVAVGRRRRGDQADAVARDRDGVRRDRAHRARREGAGHRSAGVAGREDRHPRAR